MCTARCFGRSCNMKCMQKCNLQESKYVPSLHWRKIVFWNYETWNFYPHMISRIFYFTKNFGVANLKHFKKINQIVTLGKILHKCGAGGSTPYTTEQLGSTSCCCHPTILLVIQCIRYKKYFNKITLALIFYMISTQNLTYFR